MSYLSFEKRLTNAQVILTNASEQPVLRDALANYGYDHDRLDEGRQLLDAAVNAHKAYSDEHDEQHAATSDLHAVHKMAHVTYMELVRIVRVALKKSPTLLNDLRVVGARRQDLSGWLDQAQRFYEVALENADVQAGLARFGKSVHDLQDGLAQMEAVRFADAEQEREKGDAQAATVARIEAFDALDDYVEDLVEIARIALGDDQRLEGLLVQV